jgi:photosystem II stability/assembly factor-like uncharacterized protein
MKRPLLICELILLVILNGYSQGWTKLDSGTNSNLMSVYFWNSNAGFTVGSNGVILNTIDGGKHWIHKDSGTTNALLSVCFHDSLTGFATSNHELLKTTNGGESWFVQDTASNAFLFDIHFVDQNVGFVGGGVYMLKTIDGGANWTKQKSLGGSVVSFWANDSLDLFVGLDYGWIFKSDDGGENWLEVNHQSFPVYIDDLFFINKNVGFAVGGGFAQGSDKGCIYKTTNGGMEWKLIENASFDKHFYSVCFVTDQIGYVVGNSGSIFKTTDAGINWTRLDSSINDNLKSVFFIDSLNGFVVGDNGAIWKTTTGGITASISSSETPVTVYPNPVNDRLFIEPNPNNQDGEINVYNSLGILMIKEKIGGAVSQINVSMLNPGIYILKISVNEEIRNYKFIKQ